MVIAKFFCPVKVPCRRPIYYCGVAQISLTTVIIRGCLVGSPEDVNDVDVFNLQPITFTSLSKFLDCCLATLGSNNVVFY